MTLNNFLAAWITALILIANITSPILNYFEAKETNTVIAYTECIRNDIKHNEKCLETFIGAK